MITIGRNIIGHFESLHGGEEGSQSLKYRESSCGECPDLECHEGVPLPSATCVASEILRI